MRNLLLSYRTIFTICIIQESHANWAFLAQMVPTRTICTPSATICIFAVFRPAVRQTAVQLRRTAVEFINSGGECTL
jgi:hypothetical protein